MDGQRRLACAVSVCLGMYGAPALAAPLPQNPALERKSDEILRRVTFVRAPL